MCIRDSFLIREALVDSDDSDEDDSEIKITGMFHGNRVSHDLFIKAGMEAKIESGSLFKSAKSKYPMFPVVEEKIKFDDYGEFIRLDLFEFFFLPNTVFYF